MILTLLPQLAQKIMTLPTVIQLHRKTKPLRIPELNKTNNTTQTQQNQHACIKKNNKKKPRNMPKHMQNTNKTNQHLRNKKTMKNTNQNKAFQQQIKSEILKPQSTKIKLKSINPLKQTQHTHQT